VDLVAEAYNFMLNVAYHKEHDLIFSVSKGLEMFLNPVPKTSISLML
jgi:hypothetical protein